MSRIESSLRCSAQIKSLPEFVRAEYVAAADRIAELEATITRHEESTRLAEAHLTLTLTQLAELQAALRATEEGLSARSNWICPETYALTLQAVKSEAVRADAAEAECARLRANIEAAARYGWEHDSWSWSAVKGGLDRFTDAALRGKESK